MTEAVPPAVERLPTAQPLTVNEIFFSIQGEGTRAGRPCVFVRLTGCPLRCTWCDTAYAFHEGDRRSPDSVLAAVAAYPCRLVCLTGGEPLDRRAVAIMDVKAPGSGEAHRMEWRNLDLLRARDELKLVLADRADYEWARALVAEKRLAERCPVLFSPVHGVLDPGLLGRWILDDGLPVRLQVQLHKVLWPGVERGV